MKCEYCGSENAEDAIFCVTCGKKMQEKIKTSAQFCVNCGKPLDSEAEFCSNCGEKVVRLMPTKETTSQVTSKPIVSIETPKKDKKKMIIGVVIAFIAAVAYLSIWLISQWDGVCNLEDYMSKPKQEWIDIGFEGEDDYEIYYDVDNTSIIFEKGEPYILQIDSDEFYNFHGVEVGSSTETVETLMQDNYGLIMDNDTVLTYKHKEKELWVSFEIVDGVVSRIFSTTDKTLIEVDNSEIESEAILDTSEEIVAETAETVEVPDYNGSWYDLYSQRCSMEIICQNDMYYDITLDWGSSAWENIHWEFTGEYDAEQGGIVYQNGCCYLQSYPEDGGDMQQIELYNDGEGLIYMIEGKLYWYDEKEDVGKDCIFTPSESSYDLSDLEFPYADYVLPNSDTVRLTEADVADLSLQEINYAKNEIYARHGRKFMSKELQDYFNSKDWYWGTIDGTDFDDSWLSEIERDNIKLLNELEFSISPNGYQLDQ